MDTNLRTFPDSYVEALTMLYLERQDLPAKPRKSSLKCTGRPMTKYTPPEKPLFRSARKKWLT